MKKILIIYESTTGQTKKIAEALSYQFKLKNNSVILSTPQEFTGSLDHFDAVVVGAPVRLQQYPTAIKRWVLKNTSYLNQKPSAFFSVCLGILQKDEPQVQLAERKIADDFLLATHWKPSMVHILAGVLRYTKYNWITKIIMKWIAKKAGGSVDTSKDHEYTDWNEVRQFAADFLDLLSSRQPEPVKDLL